MRVGRVSAGRWAAVALLMTTAVAGFVATTSAPASADGKPGPRPEVLQVSGPFTARGQLETCDVFLFRHIVDGSGEWAGLGASTFHLDFCIAEPPDGVHAPVVDGGIFTITTPDGTLTGSVGGHVEPYGDDDPEPELYFPFHLDLVVTGGTGRFATATGTFVVDGGFGPAAFTAEGTVTGTVTIPPGPPRSVEDCKHGGWRNHVDDAGRPFRNKRHCVRYVLDHT